MLAATIKVANGISEMLQGSREWVSFGFLVLVATYGAVPAFFLKLGHSVPPFLLTEDGLYEMTGALACILASTFLISAYWKTKPRNVWLILFAMGALVLGLEELSWGQRLMGISLPEGVKGINFQGELNLHNSKLLQSRNGDIGYLLRKSYLLYFVVFPFGLILFPSLQRFVKPMRLPTPSNLVAMAVLVAQLTHTVNVLTLVSIDMPVKGSRFAEANESNLQIILLFFAIEAWLLNKKSKSA